MTLRDLLTTHNLTPEDILDSEIYGAIRLLAAGHVVVTAELDAEGLDVRIHAQPRSRPKAVVA